ncbi:cation transporter [Enterococcus saigonensis]|uniref:Cation transporter n=1 Tax=Enterococcus saigonensis TaxID=1805431 RepID=A0A679I850_9ENTE|nr:cation diffusion facilitator family transporter [Enterococcus saigonensis]BCA85758.1 cation transporter [Enterococcus saigonensis]
MLNYFMKKVETKDSEKTRTAFGFLAGSLGLISNSLLFVMKFLIGLFAQSVSIMADAINSLSDTASSVLTLVGFHIAAKPADKEHPYGHERFEYISGFMISIIITFVGCQFLISSVEKIIDPSKIKLSPLVFIILLLSIGIKIWQSLMYQKLSATIDSETLKASSQDSLNDVMTTAAVLISAFVELFTGLHVDGWMGLVIALYILYSGLKMVKEFIDELLGSRPSTEEILKMEERLNEYPDILGYHDLLVHSYGPKKQFATVHIEVDDTWSLNYAHNIINNIEKDFREKLKVELVCHLDPVAVKSPEYQQKWELVKAAITALQLDLRVHDFRIEKEQLSFDVVVPPKCPQSDSEIREELKKYLTKQLGPITLEITFDHNYLL